VFAQIHRQLPREGPGDRLSTRRALRRVTRAILPHVILDIGCGPGMQTADLASCAIDARIIAIDVNRGYLDQLRSRIRTDGVSSGVRALQASMFAVPLLPATVDVVWAEGSIFVIGFERGLREWKALVKPGGCVAATHLTWLASEVPADARTFWDRHFPAMTTIERNLAIAAQCGYAVLEHFVLPESAWWKDYYTPLEDRLTALRALHRGDADAIAVVDGTQEQIDLYRRHAAYYGYVFYVLQRAD
jgi:ubiquinone/menaquinone biosynthesis C-methylase UbiE